MMSVEREFESLFRSQVRELESESHAKTPIKKPLPKFKRSLVESRRAMRSLTATPSISTALITAIPMTVLSVSTSA